MSEADLHSVSSSSLQQPIVLAAKTGVPANFCCGRYRKSRKRSEERPCRQCALGVAPFDCCGAGGAGNRAGGYLSARPASASSTPTAPAAPPTWSAASSADALKREARPDLPSTTSRGRPARSRRQIVARAPADGYTLLYDATAHSVNPSLFSNSLPYDTRRDLLPVFLSLQTPQHADAQRAVRGQHDPRADRSSPRAKPGALDCATTGIGTVQHVSLELLNQRAGMRDQSRARTREMGFGAERPVRRPHPAAVQQRAGTIACAAFQES